MVRRKKQARGRAFGQSPTNFRARTTSLRTCARALERVGLTRYSHVPPTHDCDSVALHTVQTTPPMPQAAGKFPA
jgi:hypothetical protein